MLYYAASNAYAQTIKEAAENTKEPVIDKVISNELLLLTHLKKNISYLSQIDKFFIDLNAVLDSDNEIIEAIEMIRMMYPATRIIILANTRKGKLIQEFLNMGIYDIIATSDFVEIKAEMELCISQGKNYKDTVELKIAAKQENITERVEYKKSIYKVLVGIAGTQKHIGCTHAAISMATWLRTKGFRVAVVEVLSPMEDASILEEMYKAQPAVKSTFRCIRDNYDEDVLSTGEFNLFGVDYYETQTPQTISKILEKSYNFILLDFGEYQKVDMIQFQKCDFRIIVTGSRDWEIMNLQNVFNTTDAESYKQFHYFFNFHDEEVRKMLRENLKQFEIAEKKIHFMPLITKGVFEYQECTDYMDMFREYFPEPESGTKKKNRFFIGRRKANGGK